MDQVLSMFTDWKMWFGNKMKVSDWQMDRALLWANYLTAKQITRREFETAKTASLDLDFPPNNPKEFLDLGRVDEFMDVYQAYIEATHNRYPTAEIYETACRVGMYELRSKSEKTMYPIWQKFYEKVCQEVRNGKVFTLPKSQRIEHKHEPVSPSVAQQYLAKMRRMVA